MSFSRYGPLSFFFFYNDTATTVIYTLSLHDALPICSLETWASGRTEIFLPQKLHSDGLSRNRVRVPAIWPREHFGHCVPRIDRKSTRLNSSHPSISYAVFCLKKKKETRTTTTLATAP